MDKTVKEVAEIIYNHTQTVGDVPVALYEQFYTGRAAGFGPWIWSINREIRNAYGLTLRKNRSMYRVANVKQSRSRASKHGRKARNQLAYQEETLAGLAARTDIPDDERALIEAQRAKAAANLMTLSRKARKNQLFAELVG